MKSGMVLAALSLGLLGVTGCANLQQPAPAPTPTPEEIHVTPLQGGLVVTIYYPDSRTMWVWVGDPRPTAKLPMKCIEVQLSADPTVAPKRLTCPASTPASGPAGPPAGSPASPPSGSPAGAPAHSH